MPDQRTDRDWGLLAARQDEQLMLAMIEFSGIVSKIRLSRFQGTTLTEHDKQNIRLTDLPCVQARLDAAINLF